MRVYLTEAIGTFFLVLTVGLTVVAGTPFAPLAIGGVLMVMVYMGGHVSGAHYNPAVTVALVMRGALPGSQLGPYVLAQLVGGTLAALTACWITGESFAPAPGAGVAALPALAIEVLFTFALALVVLNVATSAETRGNSYYGLAIGFTITAAAFAGGDISGGAFNPAVGTGPTIIHVFSHDGSWSNLWLYWVGPLVGGALAAAVFRIQEK